MNRAPVNSSNVASIGFEAGVLEVEFTSGRVYQYFGVPASVYNILMLSPSVGESFDEDVKGKYRFTRIN